MRGGWRVLDFLWYMKQQRFLSLHEREYCKNIKYNADNKQTEWSPEQIDGRGQWIGMWRGGLREEITYPGTPKHDEIKKLGRDVEKVWEVARKGKSPRDGSCDASNILDITKP
jgi:hypothetical protein